MFDRLRILFVALVAAACLAAPVRAEDDVLVNIRGPLVGKVGEKVSFDVEIVNRSGRNLEKLRVIDYFDAGFRHEASASPIEQKGTIDLAVGTARRITLEFFLAEPGRQCHRVEILDPSQRFVGGATECVQVSAAAVAQAAPLQAAPTQPAPLQPAPTTPAPLVAPFPATTPAPIAAPAPSVLQPPLATNPIPPAATASVTPTLPVAPPAPALALDLTGPVDAASGSVTEFVATVRNTGNAATTPTTLDVSWDDGLQPLEASDGYSLAGSKVSWALPAIEPGGRLRRQVNLRAQAPANLFSDSPPARACVRVELAGLPGGAVVGDHECLQIRATQSRPRLRTPSEAGLRLSLADLDDPVRLGDATTLVCTVANDSDTPSGPLTITLDLPQNARLVGDARVRVDGGRVMFDTIEVLPGQQQAFQITYRLSDPGRATAMATLTGPNLDGRLDRSCQTDFLAP